MRELQRPCREVSSGSFPQGVILIVDDSNSIAATLTEACSGIQGCDPLTVASALEAVRVLQEGTPLVRAVVTDLRMPRMDGFDLIRHIRERYSPAGLPIVVITGDTDPDTPARVAGLGANAFIPKPFSPAVLRQTLGELLNANLSSK